MTNLGTLDAYGTLTEPATLTLQRLLPGPIERVWAYLTDSDLRRQWLAAGHMEMQPEAPFRFTWRNDELTDPPGHRPEGFPEEHSMDGRITELDPPHKLSISWKNTGDVTFELEAQGSEIRLTLTHRRLPDRDVLLSVSGGWHMHLNILHARLNGTPPAPFWDGWARLRSDYDTRFPA